MFKRLWQCSGTCHNLNRESEGCRDGYFEGKIIKCKHESNDFWLWKTQKGPWRGKKVLQRAEQVRIKIPWRKGSRAEKHSKQTDEGRKELRRKL